jgi:putative tricarboxylic transport membrane protein
MFSLDPNVVAISEKTPLNNLNELIAFAKKNPKQLSVGIHSGTATAHLYMVAFMKMAGIDANVNYIPFKGGGDAKVALAGGHINLTTDVFGIFKPLLDAKKIKILGPASDVRHPLCPDIPTLKEQGVDIAWGTWHGVFAPKGTSSDIFQLLEKAIETTTKDKELLDLMNKNMFPIAYRNRQEFIRFLEKEDKIYKEIATETGLYQPKK